MFSVVFILTIDQELWACELMCRIMTLGLKEFLNQLNLLSFLNMFIFCNRSRVMNT
jgi:hypothetical protein